MVIDFQETPGAGTYKLSVPVAAHSWIQEIFVVCRNGPWDADYARLNMWDTIQAQSDPAWISSLSLKKPR